MNKFSTPFGEFDLERYPETDRNLQAWDAADRYVLSHLAERADIPEGSTLICNDQFGALTTALIEREPIVWNDSALSHQAIAANVERNTLPDGWQLLRSVEEVPELARLLGLVVVKVPKSLPFLEDQLARMAAHLSPQTVVLGAGKSKHIHTSTLKLFERYIGATRTSLAQQKSRLIFAKRAVDGAPVSPWPQSFQHEGRPVLGHAGVFSHRKLDIGTRLLLEQLASADWCERAESVLDLGCGNGLLGLEAIRRNEKLAATFVDASYAAVDSARRNVEAWFPSHTQHRFEIANSLTSLTKPNQLLVERGSVDLVLCNPPFHDNHVLGRHTANQMFRDAAAALRPGGRIVVVANRHLGYHERLRKVFGSCDVVASNRKFVVTSSLNPA